MQWRMVGLIGAILLGTIGMVWSFAVGMAMAWGDKSLVHWVAPVAVLIGGIVLFAVSLSGRRGVD